MESEVLVSSSRIWRRVVLKTRQEFSTRLHGITSQKITFLTVTKRALWCHFSYCVNSCSSLDPIHIQILSILRLPSFFCLIHFINFFSSTCSTQSDVGRNFIQATVLQSNRSETSFIDCVLSLRTWKSGITKWVGGQRGMWDGFFYFFIFIFMVQSGGRRRSCVKMLSQSRKFVPSWRLLR